MTTTPAQDGGAGEGPQMRVLAQYVKDFSFENPMAAAAARASETQPLIDMGVEVKSRPVGVEGDAFEVDLRIKVDAKRGEEPLFLVDLVYSGLFQMMNVRPDEMEPLLWIECPRLLFPFARQIIADATRNGGFPPLMLDPIDFAQMFQQKIAEEQTKAKVQMNS